MRVGLRHHVGGQQHTRENSEFFLRLFFPRLLLAVDLRFPRCCACESGCVYFHRLVLSMPTPFPRLLRSAAAPASCGSPLRLHLVPPATTPLLPLSPSSLLTSSIASSYSSVPFVFLPCRSYTTRKKNKNMPPKKAPVQEKVLLGRPGNNLKSGIVCEH